MKELLISLDNITNEMLAGNIEKYQPDIKEFLNRFLQFMPILISYYSYPQMKDLAADATYWPSQFERIMVAIDRCDDYYTLDVLYNETYANLTEVYNILKDRQVPGVE